MNQNPPVVRLGLTDTTAILWPYFRENFLDQVKSIWFIVVYLAAFQILVLGLPLVYAAMIGFGIIIVAFGLMFFMEGLRLGMMPLGETIGAVLPRNSPLPLILAFAFLLGLGATFAEPAIAVLKAAGGNIEAREAPLLYSLLNQFADQLVLAVGTGVGVAVLIGILRFFHGWSLKTLVIPTVLLLCAMTLYANNDAILAPILGLAWDCGAVTTGPVTVPLVLALGIGVCRIVGDGETSHAGFGIVTLASLAPILAVLLLGTYHYHQRDYYGAENYRGPALSIAPRPEPEIPAERELVEHEPFSAAAFNRFLATGVVEDGHRVRYEGGVRALENGRIVLRDTEIIIEKLPEERARLVSSVTWDPEQSLAARARESLALAARAIIPLSLFLLVTLKLVVREPLRNRNELIIGVAFAILGMSLFALGIALGLSPLGTQLGSNVPASFASLTPWGMSGREGPLFESPAYGKLLAVGFGFFLGYGATLAEPALNALGNTVEKITVGAFRKQTLMQAVAIGVGLGIAAGVCKLAYNLPLAYLLVPPYLGLLILTAFSSEEFVNFGWDSAGVTTGPITVPLVLAMGLGIGANVPDVSDGFGILALASVGPIITVLTVGFIVSRTSPDAPTPIDRGRRP